MLNLSIYIVARNEENFIAKCIESALATGAKDIVVGDNCSSDNTKKISESMGARVVDVKENDFPLYGYSYVYNNLAVECKNDWVLNLPGDSYIRNPEVVSKEISDNRFYYWVSFLREKNNSIVPDFQHGRFYNKKLCKYSNDLLHENLYVPAALSLNKNSRDHFLMPVNSDIKIIAQDKGERGDKWRILMHWLLFRTVHEPEFNHFINSYWIDNYYHNNKELVHKEAGRIREFYPTLPPIPSELYL